MGRPEVAKKDRGRIFSDLYDQVFTDEITADELLGPYLLLRQIEGIKRQVQQAIRGGEPVETSRLFLIDGAYHVLYTLYLLCEKVGVDPMNISKAQAKIHQAIVLVERLVGKEQKTDETFSFNRFFKDAKTKLLIKSAVKSSRFK